MGINDPCYGCKKRKVGCHSKCKDYTEWAKKIREYHKSVFDEKQKEMITNEYQIDKSRQFNKIK